MKKTVTQEHGTGCAVACVAYALGISYTKALKLFENPDQAWGKGFFCSDIVNAFNDGKRAYGFCKFSPSKVGMLKLPGVIVYVESSEQYPLGHYLIRSKNGKWMNPWFNCPIINPARSSYQKKLPGKPSYLIFPL